MMDEKEIAESRRRSILNVLQRYEGSRIKVAEALIDGSLSATDQRYVNDIVSSIVLAAVCFNVWMRLRLTLDREQG